MFFVCLTVLYVSTVYARASLVTPAGTVRWTFGTNVDGVWCANRVGGDRNPARDTKRFNDLDELLSTVCWFGERGWSTRVLTTPR